LELFITPFIPLTMKLTTKLPAAPKECINWNLYLVTWMTCLEVFTVQNVMMSVN
jgi:hypothetical protein